MKFIPFLIITISSISYSQNVNQNPWKFLAQKDSIVIEFVFYSEADNYNNGVVGKISNMNNFPLYYQFNLIFRSQDEDKEQFVEGMLKAFQVKAGSNDSLFWIPFEDCKFIGEVGVKDIKIVRIENIKKGE